MATPNLSEIVTSTHRNRSKRLIDNVSKNNGLMWKLRDGGRVKKEDGGRTLVENLEYQENSTFGYFDGYEELNIAPSEVITAAEYEWKNASVSISISGTEKRKNSGKNQILSLYKSRLKNAERTLTNNISVDLYGDGTGSSGKQIGGLGLLISTAPTSGTVGGIDRATWSFWRNIATESSGAATSSNIQTRMNGVWLQTIRQSVGDKVDLIAADNNYYQHYLESLTANQRFTDSKMADASFASLKFQGADVICDGGIDGGIGADRMIFVNTKYLSLCVHKDADFAPVGGKRQSTNQDAENEILLFMGNLTMSNAMVQAVLTDDA